MEQFATLAPGTFHLRTAVQPVTLGAPNHTFRYVGGEFVLEPGRQWRARIVALRLLDGAVVEERTENLAGRYALTGRCDDGCTIDIFPDEYFYNPPLLGPVVRVRRDTLFAGRFTFAR